MPSIADQLKTPQTLEEKEAPQGSDEVVDLSDVIDTQAPQRTWTSIFQSPLSAKFWKSFDNNAWDTIEGVITMITPYRAATQEEKDEAYREAARAGEGMEAAITARESTNMKWQLPAILPTAIQIGKELGTALFVGKKPPPFKVDAAETKTETNTPVLDEVLDYAKKTTGLGALVGDEAAKQEFYKLVEDDPFAFYAWILPIIGQLRGVKGVSIASKTARTVGKTADVLDVPIIEAGTAIAESIARFKNRALSPEMYNQPFDATYGRDTKTGQDMTSTVTPEQMTEKMGLETEDVPALGLTENPSVHHREGIVGQTQGSDAAVVKERYSKTQEAIEGKYDEIVQAAAAKAPNIDSFDIESVGQSIIDTYEAWQFARRGEFNRKFNALGQVLDQPIKSSGDFQLLGNAQRLLEELKSKPGSKLISDPEVEIIDNALQQAFDTATSDGSLTLADFDALRTQFRKNVKSALRKEALYEIGSGDPAQKMYAALTEDLYDLIENEINLAPQDFPDNFLADVKGAKADYRNIILMEDSLGAKFIRRNYEQPAKIVDYIINPNTTTKSLNEVRTILGDEMWEGLQAGFLQRILDVTEKREFKWDGLKKKIQDINAIDKNRLRTIFGDAKAKELTEFAEWSAKFAGEARWTKNSPTGFINQLVKEGGLSDMLHNIVNIATIGGVGYGATVQDIAPTAASVAAAVVINLGEKKWQSYLNSEAGRKWMLEGHQWKVVTKNDKVITIEPGDFANAVERFRIRELAQVPKHVAKQKEQKKRSQALPPAGSIFDDEIRMVQ